MLSLRINKTDRNDTVSLPELPESGWQKAVTVKSLESHRVTTVLTNRALFGRHPSEPREPVSLSAQDLLCSTRVAAASRIGGTGLDESARGGRDHRLAFKTTIDHSWRFSIRPWLEEAVVGP